jgi:hypothetical protein
VSAHEPPTAADAICCRPISVRADRVSISLNYKGQPSRQPKQIVQQPSQQHWPRHQQFRWRGDARSAVRIWPPGRTYELRGTTRRRGAPWLNRPAIVRSVRASLFYLAQSDEDMKLAAQRFEEPPETLRRPPPQAATERAVAATALPGRASIQLPANLVAERSQSARPPRLRGITD